MHVGVLPSPAVASRAFLLLVPPEGLAGRGRGSIGPQVVAPSMCEDARGHQKVGFAFGSAASLALLKLATPTPEFNPSPKARRKSIRS